jgi:hypothetical protein
MTDVDPAKSPLWTTRSLKRHSTVLEIPFLETREIARSLGGTLNTVLLAAASDASGRYHRELGTPVEHLRASMAISTRKDSGDGSQTNAFSLARLLVPTGEMPVKDRFNLVHQATLDASGASASKALDAISALSSSMPTGILTRIARKPSTSPHPMSKGLPCPSTSQVQKSLTTFRLDRWEELRST